MFEPYAVRKTLLYLVLTPSPSSPSTTDILLKYFKELGIVFRVCDCSVLTLGAHARGLL